MHACYACVSALALALVATPAPAQVRSPGRTHRTHEPWASHEPPIRVVVNCHADPFGGGNKFATYNQWIANANWLLDELEGHGAKVSWGQVGEFGEFVVEGGAAGPGAELLRRVYASGGGIQAHSHQEYHANTHVWPPVPVPGDDAWVLRNWDDALGSTEDAVLTALDPLPEPLAAIVCLRGAHLPSFEPDFHGLMASFAMPFRAAGPGEVFYRYFEHYGYHPYRPSPSNALDESLTAPFVQLVHGSVIGRAQVHFGIFQDNTLASMQAQFLLEFVNWRFRWKTGAVDRVWCFGGGGHPSDYDAGDPSRTTLPPLLDWLDAHFVGRRMPDGTLIAAYSSERAVGEEFLAWEQAHPGASSFRYPATTQDYSWYPWLRPAHEELGDARHVADLAAPAGSSAYRLTNGLGATVVLAWSDAGETILDLSPVFAGSQPVVVRGLESGVAGSAAPTAVPLGSEAVVVRR